MAQSRKSQLRDGLKLGLKELERGRALAAKPHLERAVAADPAHPEANAYLGIALLQSGDSLSAVKCMERAADRLGNQAWFAGNLAEAYFRAGRHDDAFRTFQAASSLDPNNLNYRLGMANCLALQQRFDDAAQALEGLLRLSPGHPLLWYNLGNVRRDQQRLEDAARCFRSALDVEPTWVDARNNLGSVLHALFRFDEAEREYRACIEADPERIEFQLNLASALIDCDRLAQAEEVCRRIIARHPDSAMAHTFLATALMHQGKLLQSLEHDRAAADLNPQDALARENYAYTLALAGQFDAAWPEFDRAEALRADPTPTRHARSTAYLACGRLADGWRNYTYRVTDADFAQRFPGRPRMEYLPDDSALRAGATITVVSEQGLGDELFFLRFARMLTARGARVRYKPNSKLKGLLTRAEPVATFIDNDQLGANTPLMLAGDLPHALFEAGILSSDVGSATAVDATYPPPVELHTATECLDAMRKRLRASGPPPYVAVTWVGGVPPREQKRQWSLHKTLDVTRLGQTLRDLPGTLISVQRNPVEDDARALAQAAGRTLHDYSDLNDALEDMLALLTLLDEYVGVSNTNMHMRAGTGRPARVLIPVPAEMRWPGNGPESPWFPGFVCYRQGLDGDWTDALQTLERDLRTALSTQ